MRVNGVAERSGFLRPRMKCPKACSGLDPWDKGHPPFLNTNKTVLSAPRALREAKGTADACGGAGGIP